MKKHIRRLSTAVLAATILFSVGTVPAGAVPVGRDSAPAVQKESAKSRAACSYTVLSVNASCDFGRDYNAESRPNTSIDLPRISSVSRSGSANLVQWNAVAGAKAYRVYRKGFMGSWECVADSVKEASFTDATAKSNTLYAYTVRCLDEKGRTTSVFFASETYYNNGKLASGTITVNGNTSNFENGKIRTGCQKIGGKTYYYNSNGQIQKNGIVGSASDGYFYADNNGVIDFGYCNGVTDEEGDWNVIEGKAKRVSSDSDRTLFLALKLLSQITDSSMTREQKLKVCFNHLKKGKYTEMNPRIPHYTGMDWPILYANDIFVKRIGNCISFAAAFCYLAKGIGYTEVYGCHSGGHGWAEVNGLLYDPEWSMHHSKYSYYGMSYDEPCDVHYKSAIAGKAAWMHIKI